MFYIISTESHQRLIFDLTSKIVLNVKYYPLFAKKCCRLFHFERCTEGRDLQTLKNKQIGRWLLLN